MEIVLFYSLFNISVFNISFVRKIDKSYHRRFCYLLDKVINYNKSTNSKTNTKRRFFLCTSSAPKLTSSTNNSEVCHKTNMKYCC